MTLVRKSTKRRWSSDRYGGQDTRPAQGHPREVDIFCKSAGLDQHARARVAWNVFKDRDAIAARLQGPTNGLPLQWYRCNGTWAGNIAKVGAITTGTNAKATASSKSTTAEGLSVPWQPVSMPKPGTTANSPCVRSVSWSRG